MYTIKTLQDFYALMHQSLALRRYATLLYLDNHPLSTGMIEELNEYLESLQNIPQKDEKYTLNIYRKQEIQIDLDYEISELKKDIYFLAADQASFISYLTEFNPHLKDEVNSMYKIFKDLQFDNLITDRDGTTNNYCGRYTSAIQSIYNAVFISRFAKHCVNNTVMLTSAPLDDVGLLDISTVPEGLIVYAGSKGREYFISDDNRGCLDIDPDQQSKLNELNAKLKSIVEEPKYSIFSLIGSGLQMKFGQTTIARQDINSSISDKASEEFLKLIQSTVKKIDLKEKYFRIEDTGKDIEIILTIEENKDKPDQLKDFDKGDGIKYLNKELSLNLSQGPSLVCGDTEADIPMARVAYDLNHESHTIFVTTDNNLKEQVKAACPNSYFVSTPDTLVTLFNVLATEKLGEPLSSSRF